MKKKQKKSRPKASKRPAAPQTEMPDLVSAMMKLTERLEVLEKKMDIVINQTERRPQDSRPQPQVSQHEIRPQHSYPQHLHGGNGKTLYPAVCADCRKNCEVPVKPTGERPVFCQDCFRKRKNPAASSHRAPAHHPQPQQMQKRQLKVIPNGAGRVTISEMIPDAQRNLRHAPPRPAKKTAR